MKYIIAGGRDFDNIYIMAQALDQFEKDITEVVSGTARGADSIGEQWARGRDIPIKKFEPNWEQYGKSAGFIRNSEMGAYADAAICFWNGKSAGTKHMIQTMKFQHKPYYVFNYQGEPIESGNFSER